MDCPFCAIINQKSERILREAAHCFVVLSDPCLMPGHLLVIPKRHVERLGELAPDELADVIAQTVDLQERIIAKIAPGCDISEHYRPFIPDNGLKVAHLHIHLRPRTLNDELYEKVQMRERDVFKKLDEGDVEKYRSLLAD